MDNIGVGIGVGLAIGIAFGIAFTRSKKAQDARGNGDTTSRPPRQRRCRTFNYLAKLHVLCARPRLSISRHNR